MKNSKKSIPSSSSSSSEILFVTNKMCPFAQKAWIALEAANISYKLEQVSLYGPGGKPDWFWKLNPKGQVPILQVINNNNDDNNYNNNNNNNNNNDNNDYIIADSDQILDEIVSSKTSKLFVVHSDDEAAAAVKINTFRSTLNEFLPIGKEAVLGGGDRKRMWKKLKEIDNLLGEEGPYVLDDKLTIADCAAFPFLWRINEEFSTGWKDNDCEKIPIWLDYCSKQPPFANSIQSSWWWWW
ncbi:putative dehydroascorbate reductase [Fragilariopsis cylindrus CCMP1102]|uniref:Putative dehydroascorbate reductase n=1 Tax=Fragilariopsis cylindrus CCMP1102 TaxID=635003 RepID=A0A1E7FGY0_9STRA|nr:putative dehydroascorbate reductase [Fragilariopsis cylindrus CCMP1102]|eukprot:OEU17407.1 putative dehydroascorbate reductase [Fragilariopsis cylindrus CCMP1102]